MAFYAGGGQLPTRYANGAFIGQHGSWNRRPFSGYKVVFIPFTDGRPSGMPEDVLTGFLGADGQAYGRPVGVAVDGHGALLVADDVGNAIWRVAPPVSPLNRGHLQPTPSPVSIGVQGKEKRNG